MGEERADVVIVNSTCGDFRLPAGLTLQNRTTSLFVKGVVDASQAGQKLGGLYRAFQPFVEPKGAARRIAPDGSASKNSRKKNGLVPKFETNG